MSDLYEKQRNEAMANAENWKARSKEALRKILKDNLEQCLERSEYNYINKHKSFYQLNTDQDSPCNAIIKCMTNDGFDSGYSDLRYKNITNDMPTRKWFRQVHYEHSYNYNNDEMHQLWYSE